MEVTFVIAVVDLETAIQISILALLRLSLCAPSLALLSVQMALRADVAGSERAWQGWGKLFRGASVK